MNTESNLQIKNSDAFIAFSRPFEKNHELHFVEVIDASLSDENNNKYDFVIMPFNANDNLKTYFKYRKSIVNIPFSFFSDTTLDLNIISKDNYLTDVEKVISLIKKDQLQKLVYSRLEKVTNNNSDLGVLFLKLKKEYPNAFTFIYNIPNKGCWMGASPELLLRKKGAFIETVALAGTQAVVDSNRPVVWGQKEIDEQAFIKDFVRNQLRAFSLDFKEFPTETKVAGQVCHIFNSYEITNVKSPAELILALHPGPAISGSPKSLAIQTINEMENHNRKYYTGYLGELKNDNFELYINLRSMEISEDAFYIYLGGGITKDSIAVDEWIETELKSQTMKSVINLNN